MRTNDWTVFFFILKFFFTAVVMFSSWNYFCLPKRKRIQSWCVWRSNANKAKQKSKCRLFGRHCQKTKTFSGIFNMYLENLINISASEPSIKKIWNVMVWRCWLSHNFKLITIFLGAAVDEKNLLHKNKKKIKFRYPPQFSLKYLLKRQKLGECGFHQSTKRKKLKKNHIFFFKP